MPIPRYFKFKDFIVKPGFDLELSEIRFTNLAGTNIVSYTVTATKTVKSGALNNLKDNNNATVCVFNAADLKTLEININFGSTLASTLTALLLGGGTSQDTFPYYCTIQTSTDNVNWTNYIQYTKYYPYKRLQWNGVSAFQSIAALDVKDRIFNFDDIEPTWGNTETLPDGRIRINLIYISQHHMARPLLCKPLRTGKWYFEITGADAIGAIVGTPEEAPRVSNIGGNAGPSTGVGFSSGGHSYVMSNIVGNTILGDMTRDTTYESQNTPFGVCIDLDNKKMYLINNNVTEPTAADITTSSTGEYYPAISWTTGYLSPSTLVNLGTVPFANNLPVGYTKLSDYNATVMAHSTLSVPYDTSNKLLNVLSKELYPVPAITKSINPLHIGKIIDYGRNIGYVKGNVYINSTPKAYVRRFVVLVDIRTNRTIDSMWSNAVTGDYQFNNIDIDRKYITWTYDSTNQLTPTISGVLTPQKMPIFAH